MTNICIAPECNRPRRTGRGMRYCEVCKSLAEERRRITAITHITKWREENPERLKKARKEYYARTAEYQKAKSRAWHRANPERVRARHVAQNSRKLPKVTKYGLSLESYRFLLIGQGGGCAICGRSENGKRHNFDVDHDHESGVVRGLLCNRCNRLLSNAKDSIDILKAAIKYLKASKPKATEKKP